MLNMKISQRKTINTRPVILKAPVRLRSEIRFDKTELTDEFILDTNSAPDMNPTHYWIKHKQTIQKPTGLMKDLLKLQRIFAD